MNMPTQGLIVPIGNRASPFQYYIASGEHLVGNQVHFVFRFALWQHDAWETSHCKIPLFWLRMLQFGSSEASSKSARRSRTPRYGPVGHKRSISR